MLVGRKVIEALVLESFQSSIRCYCESGCGVLHPQMSLFGRGLLLGSIGRGRGAGVLRKVGMVLGVGCGRPSRVGGASLTKALSMWAMVDR